MTTTYNTYADFGTSYIAAINAIALGQVSETKVNYSDDCAGDWAVPALDVDLTEFAGQTAHHVSGVATASFATPLAQEAKDMSITVSFGNAPAQADESVLAAFALPMDVQAVVAETKKEAPVDQEDSFVFANRAINATVSAFDLNGRDILEAADAMTDVDAIWEQIFETSAADSNPFWKLGATATQKRTANNMAA